MKAENAVRRIDRTVRQRVPEHGLPDRVSRKRHGDRRGCCSHVGVVLSGGGHVVSCPSVSRDREDSTEKSYRMTKEKSDVHSRRLQKKKPRDTNHSLKIGDGPYAAASFRSNAWTSYFPGLYTN